MLTLFFVMSSCSVVRTSAITASVMPSIEMKSTAQMVASAAVFGLSASVDMGGVLEVLESQRLRASRILERDQVALLRGPRCARDEQTEHGDETREVRGVERQLLPSSVG